MGSMIYNAFLCDCFLQVARFGRFRLEATGTVDGWSGERAAAQARGRDDGRGAVRQAGRRLLVGTTADRALQVGGTRPRQHAAARDRGAHGRGAQRRTDRADSARVARVPLRARRHPLRPLRAVPGGQGGQADARRRTQTWCHQGCQVRQKSRIYKIIFKKKVLWRPTSSILFVAVHKKTYFCAA